MRHPPFDGIKAAGRRVSDSLNAIREEIGASISGSYLEDMAKKNRNQPIMIGNGYSRVYIKDHTNSRYHAFSDAEEIITRDNCYSDGNKVHFYYCKTLQEMDEGGRVKRYIVQPPGLGDKYHIDFSDRSNFSVRLPLCLWCVELMMREAGYKIDITERRKIARHGNSEQYMNCVKGLDKGDVDAPNRAYQFFCQHVVPGRIIRVRMPSLPPQPTPDSGLGNSNDRSEYPKYWDDISRAYREICGYKCHACSVRCKRQEHRHLWDVHHINGVKSDCDDTNLRCLCKECHAKQGFHSHYANAIKPEDRKTLQKLRQEQSIPPLQK